MNIEHFIPISPDNAHTHTHTLKYYDGKKMTKNRSFSLLHELSAAREVRGRLFPPNDLMRWCMTEIRRLAPKIVKQNEYVQLDSI